MVKYEASLSTDHIGFCAFYFDVKAFLHGDQDQNLVLVDSLKDSGLGNGKRSEVGKDLLIPWQTILEKANGTNGTTFRVVLKVSAEVYTQPKPQCTYGTKKQCDTPYLKQLNNGEGSDVELACDNEVIPVHAFILKHASPVFCRMLEAPLKEAATREILIEDLRADTVKRMVDYIYNGRRISFGYDCQGINDLLYAAEKYEFDELKTACLDHMVSSMSNLNITSIRVNAGDWVVKQMVTYCLSRMWELLQRNGRISGSLLELIPSFSWELTMESSVDAE